MKFHLRSRVTRKASTFTSYDPPQSKTRHIVSEIGCTGGEGTGDRKDYNPKITREVTLYKPSLRPDEETRILKVAAEPGETLTFNDLLTEILIHDPPLLTKWDRLVVPKDWYEPIKCFKKVIVFKINYRVQEIDIRTKQRLEVDGTTYIEDEDVGDFVIYYPHSISLYLEFVHDKTCCPDRPERWPEGKHINVDAETVDDARKAAKKGKKAKFVPRGD